MNLHKKKTLHKKSKITVGSVRSTHLSKLLKDKKIYDKVEI